MKYTNIGLAITIASCPVTSLAYTADVRLFEEVKFLTSSKQKYVGIGLKVETKYLHFSFSQGAKRASRPDFGAEELQHGTSLNFQFYPFQINKFKAFLEYDHTSNIFKGEPFNSKEEPTQDFLGVGVLFNQHKNIKPSFSIGVEANDCSKSKGCYPKLSGMFKIHFLLSKVK